MGLGAFLPTLEPPRHIVRPLRLISIHHQRAFQGAVRCDADRALKPLPVWSGFRPASIFRPGVSIYRRLQQYLAGIRFGHGVFTTVHPQWPDRIRWHAEPCTARGETWLSRAEETRLSTSAAAGDAACPANAQEPGFVKWFRGAAQPTTWLAIASLTILWFGIAYQINRDRQNAYRQEVRAAEALVEVLSRQVDDSIQNGEAILLVLQRSYERTVALAGESIARSLIRSNWRRNTRLLLC